MIHYANRYSSRPYLFIPHMEDTLYFGLKISSLLLGHK